MAGHIISPTFIREVAKSGGLGSLPLGYLSIPQAQKMIQNTTAETASPFAVNHAVTHAFYNLHRAVYHFFPQWMKTMNGESIIARTGEYIESLVPV